MAHYLMKVDMKHYLVTEEGQHHEYTMDTAADVASLPTGETVTVPGALRPAPGSLCLQSDTGAIWGLSPSRQWNVVKEGIS